MLWADWILRKPTGEQESLIERPPPPELQRLFEPAAVNQRQANQAIRTGNSVAIGENARVGAELVEIKEGMGNLKRVFESAFGVLEARLDAAIRTNEARREVHLDLSAALPATAQSYSAGLFASVVDAVDDEHDGSQL